MDAKAYIEKIKSFISALEQNAPLFVEENAQDAIALVRDRIQTEGLDGVEYSKNKVLTSKLQGSAVNSAGRAFLKGKRVANYYELKQAQFGPRPGVDLTLTGKMWRGIGITDRLKSGELYIAVVGGNDPDTNYKIGENIERFGEFFNLNSQEEQIVKDNMKEKLDQLAQNLLR